MVPPLVGVAVKVTLVPEQIVVAEATIETDGVTEVTVMVITLLVAVIVVTQPALDVMTTLTWSLFASALEVNVGELAPAFTPFICHW